MKAPQRVPWWKCVVVACGLSVVGAAPARAQQYKRFEAGFFVGGMSVSHDLGTVTNIFFTTTGEADNVSFGDLLGFRFSYDFSPNLAAEASFYRAEETFSFAVNDDDIGPVDLGDQFDATVQNISGNLVAQFPFDNGLVPYATLGFAWLRTDPKNEIAGIDNDSGSGLNLGGGVKYFFARVPWLGARFDLRYQILSQGLAFADNSAEPRNTEFTIGAAFRF